MLCCYVAFWDEFWESDMNYCLVWFLVNNGQTESNAYERTVHWQRSAQKKKKKTKKNRNTWENPIECTKVDIGTGKRLATTTW